MRKISLNIIVELLSLVSFSLMVSTGFILEYVLRPGSGRKEMLNQGRHSSIVLFSGLSRHEWGEIHFWCGIIFLILLILHIFLHWKWIKAAIWVQVLWRRLALIFSLVIMIFFFLLPFLGSKEIITRVGD